MIYNLVSTFFSDLRRFGLEFFFTFYLKLGLSCNLDDGPWIRSTVNVGYLQG